MNKDRLRKSCNRLISNTADFLVPIILLTLLALPLFKKEDIAIAEEETEKIEPYIYTYFDYPDNTFGNMPDFINNLNVSFYQNWLNETIIWNLQKSIDYNNWNDCSKLLVIDKFWNPVNQTMKYTLSWVSDENAYYQLLLKTDNIEKYIDKSQNDKIDLSFKITDKEYYNITYNWSDYKHSNEYSKTRYDKSIKNINNNKKSFNWNVYTNVKMTKNEKIVIDPTFGHSDLTGYTTGAHQDDYIWSTKATTTDGGELESFNIYCSTGSSGNHIMMALYDSSYNLLVQSEEIYIPPNTAQDWHSLTPDSPIAINPSTQYFISLNIEDNESMTWWRIAETGGGSYKASTYTGTFPNPLTGVTTWNYFGAVYCTYTAGYVNTAPFFSNENIPTGSYNQTLSSIFNVDVTDANGNESTVDWYISNDNSSWNHIGHNTSILNESVNIDLTGFLDYQTLYYIKVTAADEYDNTSGYYNFETTPYRDNYFNDTFPSDNWILVNSNLSIAGDGYVNFSVGGITNVYGDFEDGSEDALFSSEDGFTHDLSDDEGWYYGSNTPSGSTGASSPHSGSYMLYIESSSGHYQYDNFCDYDFTYLGEEIVIEGYHYNYGAGCKYFKVQFIDSSSTTYDLYTATGQIQTSGTQEWTKFSKTLPSGNYSSGSSTIRFYARSADSTYTGDICLDDVYINITGSNNGYFITKNITRTGESWDTLDAHVTANESNVTYSILDSHGNVLLSSLDGNGNDISSVTNGTIQLRADTDASTSFTSYNLSWGAGGEPPQVLSNCTIYNEEPENNSINHGLNQVCNVSISQPEGKPFNYTIKCFQDKTQGNFSLNGTFSINFTGLEYKHWYYWNVSTDVAGHWTTQNYSFKTEVDPLENITNTFGVDTYARESYICNPENAEYMRGQWLEVPVNCSVYKMQIMTGLLNDTIRLQCGIYNYVDYSTYYVGTKVELSNIVEIPGTDDNKLVNFSFNDTDLLGGDKYYFLIRCVDEETLPSSIKTMYELGYSVYDANLSPVPFNNVLTGETLSSYRPYTVIYYNITGPEIHSTPEIVNPYPTNQSNNIELNTNLSINISDKDNNLMNLTFYSNVSGNYISGVVSVVNTSLEAKSSTRLPYERLCVYSESQKLWYQFFTDGADFTYGTLYYKTSSDGQTWSNQKIAMNNTGYSTAGIDIAHDQNTDDIHIVYTYAVYNPTKYRKGHLENGGISWYASVQEDILTDGYVHAEDPTICIDSNGYPWIGFINGTAPVRAYITTSSTNDGTWTKVDGYPMELSTEDNMWIDITPLNDGKLYAFYWYGYQNPVASGDVLGRLYNGFSWESEETIASGLSATERYGGACVVSRNNDVFASWTNSFTGTSTIDIYYAKRTWGEGWSTPVIIADELNDNMDSNTSPVLAINNNSELFMFFFDDTEDLYYKHAFAGSNNPIWSDSIKIATDDDLFQNTHGCQENFSDGKLGIYYLDGTSDGTYVAKFLNITVTGEKNWTKIAEYNNIKNGVYYCNSSKMGIFDDYDTKYYWNVSVNNGYNTNNSDFWFNTVSYIPEESWHDADKTFNCTIINITKWHDVDTTFNTTVVNITYWHDSDNSFNVTVINNTKWHDYDKSFNITIVNITKWHDIDKSFNCTLNNISIPDTWHDADKTFNCSIINVTRWYVSDNTFNITISNVTHWHDFDNTFNATIKNIPSWHDVDKTFNATITNMTIWHDIDKEFNCSINNISAVETWHDADKSFNCSIENITYWHDTDNTFNSSINNITHWYDAGSDFNCTIVNIEKWYNSDKSFNCIINNMTYWHDINKEFNCTLINITEERWYDSDKSFNCTITNITHWHDIDNTFNSTIINVSGRPVFGLPNPSNNSVISVNSVNWTINISSPTGLVTWYINASNGQNNSGINDGNGIKYIILTGLSRNNLYTIWVNASNSAGWTRRYYVFKCGHEDLSVHFTYKIGGHTVTVSPTVGVDVDYYKWIIDDGVQSETDWIKATDIDDYIYGLLIGDTYKITLLVKNETAMNSTYRNIDIPNYISIEPPSEEEPASIIEEPGKYHNIIEDWNISGIIRSIFGDDPNVKIAFVFLIVVIVVLILAFFKEREKINILFVEKKKKKKTMNKKKR